MLAFFRTLGAFCLLLFSAPACSGEVLVAPAPVDRGIVQVTQYPAGPTPWAGVYVALAKVVNPCTTLDTEGACRLVECGGPERQPLASCRARVSQLNVCRPT